MIDQKLGNQFILDIKKYKYRQRLQRNRMKQVCKKYKHDVSYQHLDVWNNTFRISKSLGLGICLNTKCGSTTWVIFLDMLTNPNQTYGDLRRGRVRQIQRKRVEENLMFPSWFNKSQIEDDVLSVFTFSFVRHPFLRLVSTYQNKVVEHGLHGYDSVALKWIEAMKTQYRRPDLPEHPNFAEFADMILDQGPLFNPHVMPFYYRCDYCNIHYNFIGHMETAKEDNTFIMEILGLNKDLWPGRLHASSITGESTEELARKFFSLMRKKDIENLYKMYLIDFELFAYSPDQFIALGK